MPPTPVAVSALSVLLFLSQLPGPSQVPGPPQPAIVESTSPSDMAAPQMPGMPGMDAEKPRTTDTSAGWMLMQDGLVTLMLNVQGGPRGKTELRAPNWWMGMASHRLGAGTLALHAMLSLDPATVGKCGYGELFQVGETCHGQPLVDRQHPHNLADQLAASWRVPLDDRTSFTVAGGPVGEPALGPVAFMHRPSTGGNPAAPLSHHTFDSTHIAMGVATVALDRAPFVVEASLFNGREPGENRWTVFDPGRLDSWSARFWYMPSDEWRIQLSSGHLVAPEALEPGNVQRTTTSVSWLRTSGNGLASVTAGYGRNDKTQRSLNAVFVEGMRLSGPNEVYTRLEALQVETDTLATATIGTLASTFPRQTVVAATGGVRRTIGRVAGFELSVGGDVTLYRVPSLLVATHGAHPVSAHLFLQLRPPAPMGRMWDMTMTGLTMVRRKMEEMPGM